MESAPHPRRWLILAVLSLSLIAIGLDALIIAMALPSIQTSLHASVGELQWTVDAYALAFGGLLPLAGGCADRFGRRRALLAGLAVFLAFSVAAAISPNAGVLIASRVGMGVGAALVMPATLAIIKVVFPPEEQARAIGIWAGAAGLGIPLGPVVGGLLLDSFWWGSIFLINVPIVALLFTAARALIPESRDEAHPGLDVAGGILAVGGLVVLIYGLIEAPDRGWGSPSTVVALAGGAALLVAFALWERGSAHPMLAGSLFRDRKFAGPAAAIVCLTFTMYGGLFVLTQYLQFAMEMGPMQAGIRLLAACTMAVSAPLAPRLVERFGLRPVVVLGLAFIATAGFLLAGADLGSDTRVLWSLAVLGFGVGLAMPPSAASILEAAPAHQSGAGSAVTDAAMQIGGSLGIAVMGSVVTTTYRGTLPDLDGAPIPARFAAEDSIGGAATFAADLGAPLMAAARQSFMDGMSDAMLVGGGLAAAGVLLAVFVLPGRAAPAPTSPAADEPTEARGEPVAATAEAH